MTDPSQRIDPSVGKRFPFRTSDVSDVIDGYLVFPHWHDHLELIMVMEGQIVVTVDNHTFSAHKNDIIYVNSGQIHSVKPCTSDARIIGVIFDKFFITNYMEGFETNKIYTLFIRLKQARSLFSPDHPLWEELNASIQAVFEENKRRDVCYEMAIKSYIYRIMYSIIRHFMGSDKEGSGLATIHNFASIRPVLDYIEEHYAESIYLADLCQMVNMSSYHFSRTFKRSVGMTIPDYINMTRINMAKKMLLEDERSITEIAEKVGFCNTNYFGKIFKQSTGYSPLDFRSGKITQGISE